MKILEEPPIHVKFILATTEIDKVPETILSRSLRFDFHKIHIDDILQHLKYVCEQENIEAEDEALHLVAQAARGALRDALTILEKNIIHQSLLTEHVRSTLLLIEGTLIDTIIDTLLSRDAKKMLDIMETLRHRHIEV